MFMVQCRLFLYWCCIVWLYFELIVHLFFFFLMNCSFIQNRRLLLLFFMVVSALQSLLFLNGTFMDELLVIGFKLGVPGRSRHDMVKKEKMDRIFKEKCCIAISLLVARPANMMAPSRMHKIN